MNRIQASAIRLVDSVVTELENQILDGALRPGDRIPSERKLAEDFGISRQSIREAIQKLVAKGMLVTRHGGGTTVTDRLDAPFVDPWYDLVKDHPMLPRDVLEFREMLDGQAVQLAAERATDLDIERLNQAFTRLDTAFGTNDLDECIEADVAFHQTIAEASHNVLIGHLTSSLLRVIHDHVSNNLKHLQTSPKEWARLRKQHRTIWMAIKDKKPTQANTAVKAHSEFVREILANSALDESRRLSALRRVNSNAS
jgi:GntR family transcriptional repressor for pyruvate dehydrogenase complex